MTSLDAVFNALPSRLASGLACNALDQEYPPIGNPELRALARHVLLDLPLDPRDSSWIASHLEQWLVEHEALSEEADEVHQRLLALEPVDVAAGTFPEWFATKWAKTLTVPWADDLPYAIAEARAYLAGR